MTAPEDDPNWAYLDGQLHPSQGPLLRAFEAESAASLALGPALDLPYGPHPRARFDFYRSPRPWRGTLAYLHAGFWHSRDKAQFRFLAPALLDRGLDLALVNYPLCPETALADIVAAVRAAPPAVLAHAGRLGRGGDRLILAGHSAGAHLAVELALTDWAARGMPRSPVAGVLAISGVYDLEPLPATRLNDRLRLSALDSRSLSPLHRLRGPLPPASFAVGAMETRAFRHQTETMQTAWSGAGGVANLTTIKGADHFSVLRSLVPDGALMMRILALAVEGSSA